MEEIAPAVHQNGCEGFPRDVSRWDVRSDAKSRDISTTV